MGGGSLSTLPPGVCMCIMSIATVMPMSTRSGSLDEVRNSSGSGVSVKQLDFIASPAVRVASNQLQCGLH